MPIATNCIDLILSIFSPIHSKEFHRVLKENGFVLIVSPAQNHMKELAELLYDNFKPHKSKVLEQMNESFKQVHTERKTFNIKLKSSETILDLLKMTPYYYNTEKERLYKFRKVNELKITCDFEVMVYKKISNIPHF